MPEARERPSSRPRRSGLPRISDLFDISDEMISFAEKYQKVWESEAKATLALGEFLGGRADSMRCSTDRKSANGPRVDPQEIEEVLR